MKLTSFTSNVDGNSINLTWKTATEQNNNGFEIDKKLNDGSFSKIAFISGNGTTSETHSYSYSDKNLSNGKYSYRLKQIDYDGKEKFSKIIEAELNMPVKFRLNQNYPNPFNPSTNISYSLATKQFVTIKVYNVIGKEITTLVNEEKPEGQYSVNFNASNISSGVYFYTIRAGSFIESKKMILLK